MKYCVDVSEIAASDLRRYYRRACTDAPRSAERWLRRFHEALASLANFPQRCATAPESKRSVIEIRQMLFGKGRGGYRVLFTIREDVVRILHIRRVSRDTAGLDELFGEDGPPSL